MDMTVEAKRLPPVLDRMPVSEVLAALASAVWALQAEVDDLKKRVR